MNSCVTDGREVRDEAQSSRSNLCDLCLTFVPFASKTILQPDAKPAMKHKARGVTFSVFASTLRALRAIWIW